MNNIQSIIDKLIQQPVVLQYDNQLSIAQKIAGIILLVFFLLLGVGIIMNGLKVEKGKVYYLLFGTILCLFPVIFFFIMQHSKNKQIILLDKNGVALRNKQAYQWQNLKCIIYNTSLYEQNENNRFVSVQFIFSNGEAVANFKADKFFDVLFIANNLQVEKIEKSATYFK